VWRETNAKRRRNACCATSIPAINAYAIVVLCACVRSQDRQTDSRGYFLWLFFIERCIIVCAQLMCAQLMSVVVVVVIIVL
jgi:hypothetical protein